ncbi:MAG: hypothetical protein R3B47_18175 [Bacteroidia bacterium]
MDACEQYFLQNHWIEAVITLIDRPLVYTTAATPDDGTGNGTASVTVTDDVPVTYTWFSIDGNNSNLPNTASLTGLNAGLLGVGIGVDGFNCGGEKVSSTR